jgi:uncharacterized protein (TIGR02145 family)
MGAVEIVRIVKDETSSGTFDFTQINQGTGTVQMSIAAEMGDPIDISLSGQQDQIAEGGSMTVTASVPPEAGNVTYVWYINGESQNTGESFTVSGLPTGVYRLDVTAISTDGKRAGSENCAFSVGNTETSTCPGVPTVEYEGKTYNTVQIGNQCWLKENLNVGTMIVSNGTADNQTSNGMIEKYCYDNEPANCDIYGGLYQWNEAMQYATSEGAQGICPDGWHIPTLAEYETLENFVNDEGAKLVREDQPATVYTPTNETGFSALFTGFRWGYDGQFQIDYVGHCYFWSSTHNGNHAWYMRLYYSEVPVNFFLLINNWGISVRCLQD